MGRAVLLRAMAALGLLAVTTAAAAARPPVPFPPQEFGAHELARCLGCHGLPNFLYRDTLTAAVRDLSVDTRDYVTSAHGALECTQCHPDVRKYPHEFEGGHRRPVSCDFDCHATDVQGKPVVHRTQVADFLAGAHRKGLTGESADSPTCVTCHGAGRPHAMVIPRLTITPQAKMKLCAECHEDRARMARAKVDADAVPSYRRSFHYKAIRLGAKTTAVCQDCHAVHRVLPPDSTASTVNAANLMKTCGQKDCHKDPPRAFATSGANHLGLRARRDPALLVEERTLVAITFLIMALVVADMLLDAARRLLAGRARARRGVRTAALAGWAEPVARLTVAQRLQHAALVASFLVLAVTGLPLRFPDSPALAALYGLLGGLPVARALHRGAAVVMVLVGLSHLAYALVLMARRRAGALDAWRMLPNRDDVARAKELTLYLAGRRALPPESGRFDVRNKLHYLAVGWGLPVMALSGLVLWFPMAIGGRLPDLALGMAFIAHSDEALLAIGVVLIWHLYVVHVSPGAHRRFWTWIDGRVSRAHSLLRHPREAEQATGAPVSVATRRSLLEESWTPRSERRTEG